MRRRPSWPVVVVVSLAFAALMSACSSGSSSSVSATAAASPSSTAPAPSAASTVSPSAQPTVAAVPLVVCRTTFGITPPPAPKAQPTSVAISVPGGSGSSDLAVYTDDQGYMRLLGPQGWSCSAMYGADGSGGVVVYPAGEPVPSDGAGWKLSADSSVQAIIGSQSSACMGCAEAQACPLFGTAAKDFQANFQRPCPASRPAAETTTQLSTGVMAFADPAGVAGDGVPSGGRYPANGVMTYYSGNSAGSWVETCTLPTASKDVCTATLDYFLASYRNR